jgi:hypothetical protein
VEICSFISERSRARSRAGQQQQNECDMCVHEV